MFSSTIFSTGLLLARAAEFTRFTCALPGDLLVPLSADQLARARGRPCPSVRGLAGSIQPPASRAGHERPRRFHNHEDGSTGVFVLLKMPTSAFTRKNLLRDYAEWTLTHND